MQSAQHTLKEIEQLEAQLESAQKLKQKALQQAINEKPKGKFSPWAKLSMLAVLPTTYAAYHYIPTQDLPIAGLAVIMVGGLLLWALRKETRPAVDVDIEEIKGADTFRVHYVAKPETILDIRIADIKAIDGVPLNVYTEAKALLALRKLLTKGQPELTRGAVKDGYHVSHLSVRSHTPLKGGKYKHTDIAAWLVRNGLRYPDETQNPTSHLYTALKTAKDRGAGYWKDKGKS